MATVIKVPVSQARTRLSQIVRRVHEDPDLIYQITVNQSVVAEISSPVGQRPVRGGEAAQALLEVGSADASDQLPHTSGPSIFD